MKTNFVSKFSFVLLIFLSCSTVNLGQGFRGIIPLESTCEDLQRIFKIEKCVYPQSVFFLKDFWLTVNFGSSKPDQNDRQCYRVPAERILTLMVTYNRPIPIKEFEYDLKYAEGPFGDISTTRYENVDKGVSVLTNLGHINTALFIPSPKQWKMFSCACK